MPTKPNAKDYALPPSCISADENAEGGLAKHLEPLCLSLAERVLLYNQEVLFCQGKEILQGLAKLNAKSAIAAAVNGGLAPAAIANVGLAPAANAGPATNPGPAAARTPNVKSYGEAFAFASAARAARVLAFAFSEEAHAAEDEEARKKVLKCAEGLTKNAAKTILAKDKDIFSDVESSATEGRERGTTKAGEKSHSTQSLVTGIGGHDGIKSNDLRAVAGRAKCTKQQRKALSQARELDIALAREHSDKNIVPKPRTTIVVGKTMEKDNTNTARIKEKNLNKRVRSPVLTSNSEAEDLHRNKKVKVEVKVKSEPGNGAL